MKLMVIFRSCHNTRYLWQDLAPRGDLYLSYSKTMASKTVSLFTFSPKMRWKYWSKWSISKESAWSKQTPMLFGTNLTRRAQRDPSPLFSWSYHNGKLLGRDSWRVTTARVQSFVLISMLRGQPRTPIGDDLAVLNYDLKVSRTSVICMLLNLGQKHWSCILFETHWNQVYTYDGLWPDCRDFSVHFCPSYTYLSELFCNKSWRVC